MGAIPSKPLRERERDKEALMSLKWNDEAHVAEHLPNVVNTDLQSEPCVPMQIYIYTMALQLFMRPHELFCRNSSHDPLLGVARSQASSQTLLTTWLRTLSAFP